MQAATNTQRDSSFIAFAKRRHREMDLAPESQAELERRRQARLDADHSAWAASGEPDVFAEMMLKRRAKRIGRRSPEAIAEQAAITRERRRVYMHRDSTEADCEAADAAEATAMNAWRAKWNFVKGAEIMAANVYPFPTSQPQQPAAPLPSLVKSSADFVRGFVPPEYVVDHVLQRRFCYSMTAKTGVGKTATAMRIVAHVSIGRPLGSLDVAKGTVLYFAGENPTDVQMRWLGLTREMGIDPATADVHFVAGAVPLSTIAERITAEVAQRGLTLALVVVDTAAAYFEGDDENSNAQAVDHAKRLRSLTALPGGPTVLILCHPTKRAADDDLIPRGGGAFLAEVDGNIALRARDGVVVAEAHGKFRGPEFAPLSFALRTTYHPTLRDARGRDIPTVVAAPVSEADKAQMTAAARRHEDLVLKSVETHPEASVRDRAAQLGWLYRSGKPDVSKVSRALATLEREKLIRALRGRWELTAAGEKELNRLDLGPRDSVRHPMFPSETATPLPPPANTR